jgi:phage tail tape-measure protein
MTSVAAGTVAGSVTGALTAFATGAAAGSWIPVIGSIFGGILGCMIVGFTTEKAINAICDNYWFDNEDENN